MKSAVITGATGMIGVALTQLLVERNIQVLAVVRPKSLNIDRLPKSKFLQVIECDADNMQDLEEKVNEKYDAFFHFAWEGTTAATRGNIQGQTKNIVNTMNAIAIAKSLGCKKFIGAGSQAEYGIAKEKLTAELACNPLTAYGIAKYAAGRMGMLYARDLGIDYNWCRILSVYGIWDNSSTMIMTALHKMINGEACNLSTCDQIWDYLYCTDAAEAFYSVGEKGVNGKVYLIGSGASCGGGKPLKEYVDMMYAIVGNKKSKLNFGAVPTTANSVRYLFGDIGELTRDTGFLPSVNFETGIKKTLEWIKSR